MPQQQQLIHGKNSPLPKYYADQVRGVEKFSPYPAPIFPPTWRGRYPHLMPADIAIWTRFLEKYGDEYIGFQYDVLLGRGALKPADFPAWESKLLYLLTVKRVDCLGIRKDGVTLFEVKPRLGMAAIGQCVTYRALWHMHFGNIVNLLSAAVVEMDEPDIAYAFAAEQLAYIVV
jgi:hypothetical protein